MIHILILTNDIDEWLFRITKEIHHCRCDRLRDSMRVTSELFVFEIRSSFLISARGLCYSCAILDKELDRKIECENLQPCVKASVITTNKYWESSK